MAYRTRNPCTIMETTAQFDLERAILEWRKTLAECPAIRGVDLEELESHLRDSVASLQGTGLTLQEAFMVARSRLGGFQLLSEEFGKVNVRQIWIQRVVWMLVGSMALSVASNVVTGLLSLISLGMFKLAIPASLAGTASVILQLAMLAALLAFLWRSGTSRESAIWRAAGWLKQRPIAAGLIAIVLTIFAFSISTGAVMLMKRWMPPQTLGAFWMWRWPASLLSMLLYPAALTWLLLRQKSVSQHTSHHATL